MGNSTNFWENKRHQVEIKSELQEKKEAERKLHFCMSLASYKEKLNTTENICALISKLKNFDWFFYWYKKLWSTRYVFFSLFRYQPCHRLNKMYKVRYLIRSFEIYLKSYSSCLILLTSLYDTLRIIEI